MRGDTLCDTAFPSPCSPKILCTDSMQWRLQTCPKEKSVIDTIKHARVWRRSVRTYLLASFKFPSRTGENAVRAMYPLEEGTVAAMSSTLEVPQTSSFEKDSASLLQA